MCSVFGGSSLSCLGQNPSPDYISALSLLASPRRRCCKRPLTACARRPQLTQRTSMPIKHLESKLFMTRLARGKTDCFLFRVFQISRLPFGTEAPANPTSISIIRLATGNRCLVLSSALDGQPAFSRTVVSSNRRSPISAHSTNWSWPSSTRKTTYQACFCLPRIDSEQEMEIPTQSRTHWSMQRSPRRVGEIRTRTGRCSNQVVWGSKQLCPMGPLEDGSANF